MNTFNIIARKRPNKEGKLPLYFISTLNRRTAIKSIGFCVNPKEWDALNKKIIGNSVEALKIAEIKEKANRISLKYRLEEKTVSNEEYIKQVFGCTKNSNNSDFYDFFETFLNQKDYPLKHVSSYETLKEQLIQYNKYVTFKELNYSFCVGFSSYLKTEFKNSNNTRIKKIQLLRCIISEAIKHGHINSNPAQDVKLKAEKTNRQALSKEDLTKLENLYILGELPAGRQNVLTYFLFCCYTGLRFGDLLAFKKTDITNGVIKIKQHKTGGLVSIPLIDKARALLPDYQFKVLTNQKSNEHLKAIQNVLKIKTTISCHVARHTFATIGLNCGIPLEVVSEVLGHSSTRVTKIYAKMLDEYKINELKKWTN